MKRVILALLVGCLGAGAIVPGGKALPPQGRVYVNDNTAGTNAIAAYDRQPNGTLTPIPGSPFTTGGAGTGHADASQGSLQLSADGRFILAVDAGSAQISVLRVKPDGSLELADLVSSGGGNPVSIAIHDQFVFVANADPTAPNYTGFTLSADGQLTPIPDSTVSLPAASQPGDILFDKHGSRLIGTRVGSSLIDSFTVGPKGELRAAPGSPFPSQTGFFGPFGSAFNPTKPDQLFVSNAHTAAGGPAQPGSVSVFTAGRGGVLSAVGGSPFFNDGIASCWVEVSRDGRFLYTVNTGSSTVSTYSIAHDGALSFTGSAAIGGAGAEDVRLAPDGDTLWVVVSGADMIAGFSVGRDGALTSLGPETPGPEGATPSGIVVT